MSSLKRSQIVDRVKSSKEYRDALVEADAINGLPFQIRALQEARDWTQKELGERAGMKQTQISYLERAGYDGYTLKTLWRLAHAFDVALIVRFAAFSDLVDRMVSELEEDLNVPSVDEDIGLSNQHQTIMVTGIPSGEAFGVSNQPKIINISAFRAGRESSSATVLSTPFAETSTRAEATG